jgi:hypothetical protein
MLSNLVGEDWVSKEACFFHDLCAASINLSLPGPSWPSLDHGRHFTGSFPVTVTWDGVVGLGGV